MLMLVKGPTLLPRVPSSFQGECSPSVAERGTDSELYGIGTFKDRSFCIGFVNMECGAVVKIVLAHEFLGGHQPQPCSTSPLVSRVCVLLACYAVKLLMLLLQFGLRIVFDMFFLVLTIFSVHQTVFPQVRYTIQRPHLKTSGSLGASH